MKIVQAVKKLISWSISLAWLNFRRRPNASEPLRWHIWPTLPLHNFMRFSQKMPLYFLYTIMKKVKMTKNLNQGADAKWNQHASWLFRTFDRKNTLVWTLGILCVRCVTCVRDREKERGWGETKWRHQSIAEFTFSLAQNSHSFVRFVSPLSLSLWNGHHCGAMNSQFPLPKGSHLLLSPSKMARHVIEEPKFYDQMCSGNVLLHFEIRNQDCWK